MRKKGNDHLLKKLLIVVQIFLFSTIRNEYLPSIMQNMSMQGKHTWPWCIWLVERVAHFLRPITEQRKKKLVHSHFVFTNQLQIIISTPYLPCFTFACDVIHQVQDANGTRRRGGLGMIYSWGKKKKKDISFGGSRLFQQSSNCKAKRTCYYIRLILLILVYIKAPSLPTPKQVKTANKIYKL